MYTGNTLATINAIGDSVTTGIRLQLEGDFTSDNTEVMIVTDHDHGNIEFRNARLETRAAAMAVIDFTSATADTITSSFLLNGCTLINDGANDLITSSGAVAKAIEVVGSVTNSLSLTDANVTLNGSLLQLSII